MKFKVVYEDNHIIVVIKPKNIPSQSDKSGDKDMLSLVKEYIKEKYNKIGNVYLALIHRLDRMTEGLMVFAKTQKAASRLSNYIQQHEFKKEYLAVVYGNLEIGTKKTLEDYVIKNEKNNISKVVSKNKKGAKLARLEYLVVGNTQYLKQDLSYIKVKLYTGRHHQIRVQMANIGHPLVGDVKYGKNIKGDLALFAYYLKFIHPTKDEIMEFKVLPKKLKIWKGLDIT